MGWTKMKSMELDDEDRVDMFPEGMPFDMARPNGPKFPYGLRICLTHSELRKLSLEADCEIGDIIDIRAFAKVTSVSQNETERGVECRVELQIEELALEDESDESGPEKEEK